MNKKPSFTQEELLFIEKIMDIQSSYAGDRLNKCIENHWIAKVKKQDKESELILKIFFENGETYLITKTIRDKIEKWRR